MIRNDLLFQLFCASDLSREPTNGEVVAFAARDAGDGVVAGDPS
jgi:hypothetical protein